MSKFIDSLSFLFQPANWLTGKPDPVWQHIPTKKVAEIGDRKQSLYTAKIGNHEYYVTDINGDVAIGPKVEKWTQYSQD